MANPTRQSRHRRKMQAAPKAAERAASATDMDRSISPQDFYHEMVVRDDVRRILTRLAQNDDGRV